LLNELHGAENTVFCKSRAGLKFTHACIVIFALICILNSPASSARLSGVLHESARVIVDHIDGKKKP